MNDMTLTLPSTRAKASFDQYAAPLIDEATQRATALQSSSDAEILHQLRVALRRLRTLFWAYRPVLNKEFDDRERAVLRFVANAAGRTRDWDILIGLLPVEDDDPARHALQTRREEVLKTSRETIANADVANMLRGALTSAHREFGEAGERISIDKLAARRLRDAHRQLNRRIRHALKAKRPDYAALHDVRKAGKKVRYLLDFFEPILPRKALKGRKRLKRMQKRFGDLNDVVASRNLLANERGDISGLDAKQIKRALRDLKVKQKHRQEKALACIL
jgi:CHAD domain-containing protein